MTTRLPRPVDPLVTADLARDAAVAQRVCVRPVMRTVTDRATGHTWTVPIPCGSTRETICPPCSAKARRLRAHQCAEGWHLVDEPEPSRRDDEPADAQDTGDAEPDGDVAEEVGERRTRSTRRRRDVPDLPRVPMQDRTVGQTFTAPSGRTYRPSSFVTLTLDSYGRVHPGTGVPVDPDTYDYRRAALDALHLPKLFDRWVQNLRRCAGYKVQYFAAIEPQRRLAPHMHLAIRGAIPRATLRAVTKATYAAVWWPAHDEPAYPRADVDPDRQPTWDRTENQYVCPDSGAPLPTWDQALDDLDATLDADPATRPTHLARFGRQVDIKGIIAPSRDADRAVRYLTKYLTKSIATSHTDNDGAGELDAAYEAHIDRLHEHVRWLPCSPACANWLHYGIQPQNPGPGLIAGQCPAKAHDRECLGVGGRRCLVSRAWTGKTLTEHRADRAAVIHQVLDAVGIEAPETRRCAADVLDTDGRPRFVWQDLPVTERDYVAVIADSLRQQQRWRAEYERAKTVAAQRDGPPARDDVVPVDELSATTIRHPAA
ncbi:MAG: replication initiator [Angustibacter sp.]